MASPLAGLGVFAAVDDGGDVVRVNCSFTEQFTSSGAASMPTLSGDGCSDDDKIAYLDNGVGFVVFAPPPSSNKTFESTSLGPADAVHISPDGSRVLLLFNATLQVCSVTGADCTLVFPPEGGDLNTATFAPDSNHIVFRAPVDDRMQVVMVDLDGSGAQQLTQLTNADVVLMQPFVDWIALTVQYGPTDYRIATVNPATGEFVVRVEGGWNTFAVDARP